MEIDTAQKLNKLENEIVALKILLMKFLQKKKLESLRLEGSLEGIEINEEDIKKAKESLFNH